MTWRHDVTASYKWKINNIFELCDSKNHRKQKKNHLSITSRSWDMYSQFFDFMTSRRNAMTSHDVTFGWFYSAYCVQRWFFYHLWKFHQYIFNGKKVTAILVFGSFPPPFTVNVSFFSGPLVWGLISMFWRIIILTVSLCLAMVVAN